MSDSAKSDYYGVLGVGHGATTTEDIKAVRTKIFSPT